MRNDFKSIRDYLPGKVFLLMVAVLFLFPCVASAFYQEEKITLEVKNMPLKQFIGELRKSTKLDVVYASEDLDTKYKVTYSCSGKTITEVLSEALGKMWP